MNITARHNAVVQRRNRFATATSTGHPPEQPTQTNQRQTRAPIKRIFQQARIPGISRFRILYRRDYDRRNGLFDCRRLDRLRRNLILGFLLSLFGSLFFHFDQRLHIRNLLFQCGYPAA